eukprot:scaffold55174_cov19-Tisochrysis_lutea.AAC.1
MAPACPIRRPGGAVKPAKAWWGKYCWTRIEACKSITWKALLGARSTLQMHSKGKQPGSAGHFSCLQGSPFFFTVGRASLSNHGFEDAVPRTTPGPGHTIWAMHALNAGSTPFSMPCKLSLLVVGAMSPLSISCQWTHRPLTLGMHGVSWPLPWHAWGTYPWAFHASACIRNTQLPLLVILTPGHSMPVHASGTRSCPYWPFSPLGVSRQCMHQKCAAAPFGSFSPLGIPCQCMHQEHTGPKNRAGINHAGIKNRSGINTRIQRADQGCMRPSDQSADFEEHTYFAQTQ